MKPPILVVGDDVDLFASVEAAERYLEPVDVPHLRVFDSEGRFLRPVITDRFLTMVVKLEEDSTGARDVGQLRQGLVRLLVANEQLMPQSLEEMGLNELVQKALAYTSR